MCCEFVGSTAAVGSLAWRSPPAEASGASFEQLAIVTSLPPSWRTYGRSVILTSADAVPAHARTRAAVSAARRTGVLIGSPLPRMVPTPRSARDNTPAATDRPPALDRLVLARTGNEEGHAGARQT